MTRYAKIFLIGQPKKKPCMCIIMSLLCIYDSINCIALNNNLTLKTCFSLIYALIQTKLLRYPLPFFFIMQKEQYNRIRATYSIHQNHTNTHIKHTTSKPGLLFILFFWTLFRCAHYHTHTFWYIFFFLVRFWHQIS